MSEVKPKIEKKGGGRRPPRQQGGPTKKEFTTKVLGLESHTFDIGNAKYAAKYKKSVDEIANYIQKEYKGGSDVAKAIRELKLPVITLPSYPLGTSGDPPDPGMVYMWQQDVTAAKKQIVQLEENKKRAYALVIGQCSPDLDSKLRGSAAYPQADADQDVVQLLLIIRGYCCSFDDHQESTWALEAAKQRVSLYYQGHDVSNTDYIEHFKALVGVVETYGGAYGREPGLVAKQLVEDGLPAADVDKATPAQIKAAEEKTREAYLSCMVLRGADNGRYHPLKTDLSNNMTLGTDKFPKTMVETMRLLTDYKAPPRLQRVREAGGEGLAFVQGDGGKKRETPSNADEVKCWHCDKIGHYKSDCPELQVLDVGVQNLNIDEYDDAHNLFSADDGYGFVQKQKKGVRGILSPHHVYIDTCASYASTPYPELLKDTKVESRGLVGHSNAGSVGMQSTGEFGAIKKMWLNEGGVATIIPLKQLEKLWRITYDSKRHDGSFVIHTDDGHVICRQNEKGMPYLDLRELEAEAALSFVQTVRGNMEGFTKREVQEARQAREAQAMLGHPTDRDFLGMVRNNMIPDCPVTLNAAKNAHVIFGPDPAGIMGRTVRTPPEPVTTDYVQIPRTILERHQLVTLAMDVMFVNGVPFLVSVARGLNFITAEYTPSRTAKQLAGGISRIMDLYVRGGFQVGRVLVDNEFEPLRSLVPIIAINTTAAKEHVPEVERKIRLIKERGRGILNTLPFKKMPRLMLIELIYHVVLWLNAMPVKSGVSETLSPREIVMRHKLTFSKHCKGVFGSFCHAHDEPTPTNSMVSRTSPCILLGPTGNLQGTYKLLNLNTGAKIKRRKWSPSPMPDSVIRQVERMSQSALLPGTFDFSDRNGILFEWNEEVDETPEGIVEEEDVVLYPSLAAEQPGVVLGRDQPMPSIEMDLIPQGQAEDAAARNGNIDPFDVAGVDVQQPTHNVHVVGDGDGDDDGIIAVADLPPNAPPHPLVIGDTDDDEDDEDETIANDSDDDDEDDQGGNDGPADAEADDAEADEQPNAEGLGVRRSKRAKTSTTTTKYAEYGLMMAARREARGGPRRALVRDGCVLFSADDLSDARPIPEADREEYALGVALVHYSMNAGIKKFKKKGEAGVTKELTQMHDMNVFRPIDSITMTRDEKKAALSSLMFLKEKRDTTVKARMCADGRKQRDGTWTKQETTSPTVSTEAVFITAVIDAHEGRDVGCFDIPGAFLHADVDEDITMVLKGRLAELMVQVAPNLYRKYISVDSKGTAILYVKMQKALYGLLRSALLFYRKLVADIQGEGFILNPYDPCVANKDIGGKQMTICWHVDDLKVSHCDPEQVTKFGNWLNEKYGVEVAAHRGKVHDYLGMIFDFSVKGKVMVNMIEYIKNIIKDFPEEIIACKASPAADHLFTVRDPELAKPLPEEQAMAFHHAAAQVLFLSARARRDIQPATAFLTTRVREPDEDDWGKVKRLLGYLKGTIHMPLILSADSLTMSRWWVDAAYAVHSDCRGHTGAGMSLGQGMVLSYSWKQKINTKSSTEAELVGVDDSLGYILWARYFMQEQGYDMDASLLYQDNMSAILLETNGKASSTKRTKHIKVKYFFIKDKVDQGEIRIEHCPTDQMWTDINTKPKQGLYFRTFRSHVMGIPVDYRDEDFAAGCYFRPSDWTPEPVSMLPIPKDRAASQECVGENEKQPKRANARRGKKTRFTADVEVRASPEGECVRKPMKGSCSGEAAPIKWIGGRAWSPGVYRSLRALGKSLDVAWEKAFIRQD